MGRRIFLEFIFVWGGKRNRRHGTETLENFIFVLFTEHIVYTDGMSYKSRRIQFLGCVFEFMKQKEFYFVNQLRVSLLLQKGMESWSEIYLNQPGMIFMKPVASIVQVNTIIPRYFFCFFRQKLEIYFH